jgi:hypothetical protein
MNIIKLNYTDKETAVADLLAKEVYIEVIFKEVTSLVYREGVQAVVEIGKIAEVPGTYDEQGNVIIEPIYYNGVFYDVMCIQDIDFGSNEVFPVEAVHSFAGYNPNADGPVNIPLSVIVPENK